MNFLKTSCRYVSRVAHDPSSFILRAYLNRANIGVLRRVLVLVEAILGELALSEVDAQFDEEEHHRLDGGDGAVPGPLVGDMFVEERQRGLGLLYADELLGAFAGEVLAGQWTWRLPRGPTHRVFSGLLCGGGAMLGRFGSLIRLRGCYGLLRTRSSGG